MAKNTNSNDLQRRWDTLCTIPFGKNIFNFLISLYIPYTGSISAKVQELKPGYAKVTLGDRRKVRNHLKSVHAIALANLAEYTGNLALVCSMPEDARFIVKNISIDYIKKARGTLIAECHAPFVENSEKKEFSVEVTIRDSDGDVVVTGKLLTLVGPKKTESK